MERGGVDLPGAATASTDARSTPLPTGTLTFLLTDVVDSTLLWDVAPDVMDRTLARHDAIIDRAVESHGGLVLKHKGEGDSTFCVFRSPAAAAAAAITAQRALHDEPWHPRTPIKVRMGINTGESILRGVDYYGQTVNRAARVRAVADGGQVFVGRATAFAIGDDVPDGVEMRFLRREQLKGIGQAEEIYELVDSRHADDTGSTVVVDRQPPLPDAVVAALPDTLVGRSETLSLIADFLGQPRSGARLLVLRGAPGAGKSTVAAAGASSAHEAGATVLYGACGEKLDTPFEPFRSIVGAYVDHAPRDVLVGHIAERGGEISRLAPRLRLRVGAIPLDTGLDPETARLLLIEATVDLLQRAVQDRPVLIVVDDLHWADQNSVLMIEHLLRVDGPLTIVATSWPATDPTAASLDALLSLPNTFEAQVRGFDAAEIVGLLTELGGSDVAEPSEVAAYFLEETGGNPFFVVELFRHLSETGVVSRPDGPEGALHFALHGGAAPQSIRSVIRERLARLPPDTGRVLSLASVAGREFDPTLLATVLDIDEDAVLDAVEAAARVSLVREVGVDRFEFEHALVQHTLYDQLSASRAARQHRRLAGALESLHGDDANPTLVAGHWLRAGPACRAELGRWARRAGASAMEELAPDDAIRWYTHALAAADDDRERLAILLDLGAAQRWTDDDASRRTLLDAAELAERVGDAEALVRAALTNNRGGASAAGRIDPGRVRVLERALSVVGADDSEERARLLATLAIEHSQGSDWDLAEQYARDAKECARRLGDDTTTLRVLLLTTEATRVPKMLEERLGDSAGLLELARRADDPVMLGTAALRDVRVKLEAAQFDAVGPSLEILRQNARLDPYLGWNHLCVLAVHEHACGRLERALEIAQQAYDTSGSQPDRDAVYLAATAAVRWDQGRLDEMLPLIEAIAERYPGITGFRANLALARCNAGLEDAARDLLRHEVATGFAEHPMNPLWLITMALFASAAIELDDAEAAELLDDRLRPWSGRANTSVVSINGLVTETLAGLSVVRGDFDAAERDADAALDQATRLGARVSATRTHLARARLWARRDGPGDRERALAEAQRCAGMATEIGMHRVRRQAQALADALV